MFGPKVTSKNRAEPFPAKAPREDAGGDTEVNVQDSPIDELTQEVSEPLKEPPRDRTKAARLELSSLKEALEAGWSPVDLGGNGDCGDRALANAFHTQTNPENLSQQEVVKEAAWLRAQMICHVEKHAERLQSVLVKEKNTSPEVPAPKNSIRNWISDAARPDTWIDGLAL